MKQLKFLVYGLSFLLISSAATGQNLTGVWRGIFYNPTEIAMGGSKYRYEVQINNDGRSTSGVTYSYQTTRFYGKASMVGVWSPSTKNLVLQEDKMLELKIADGGDGCLMTCYLTYRKEDGKEYLEGSYTSYNMNNKTTNCGGGRVFLEKVPDSDFELEDFLVKKPSGSTGKVKPGQEDFLVNKPPVTTTKPPVNKPPVTTTKPPVSTAKPPASGSKPPATAGKPPAAPKPAATKPPATAAKPPVAKPQTPPATANATVKPPAAKPQELETQGPAEIAARATEPVKPRQPVTPPPAVLKERKNELFKTITTSEKIIEISLYDNGEIDGDTISVYSNNRLVASKKGLSARPIVIKIELDNEEAQQDLVMVAENLGSIPPNTALMIVKAGDQRYTLYLSSTEQKNAMVRFRYEAK